MIFSISAALPALVLSLGIVGLTINDYRQKNPPSNMDLAVLACFVGSMTLAGGRLLYVAFAS